MLGAHGGTGAVCGISVSTGALQAGASGQGDGIHFSADRRKAEMQHRKDLRLMFPTLPHVAVVL